MFGEINRNRPLIAFKRDYEASLLLISSNLFEKFSGEQKICFSKKILWDEIAIFVTKSFYVMVINQTSILQHIICKHTT